MQKIIVVTIALMLSVSSLFAQKAGKGEAPTPSEYYSCPNHNKITSQKPGKCSICGTELSLTSKEKMASGISKRYTCPAHMDVVSHDPGKCPKCGRKLNLSAKEQLKSEVTKVYTCPMHPEVALDKEGNCPECGKPLVEKVKKS
jgi:transcription initiation factor IIE alpha subunit